MNTKQIAVNFDHAEFEIDVIEEAHRFIRINPNMGIEAIASTARDLVYATHGRATMYLDSIQDMIDWIASTGILARGYLGEWHKSEFGYILPIIIGANQSNSIEVWIYALSDDNGQNYSHTILVGAEFAEFESMLIATKEEARLLDRVGSAIKFASYVHSRMVRGLPIYAHVGTLENMLFDISNDPSGGDYTALYLAWVEATNARKDYDCALIAPWLYADFEYCVLRDIADCIAQMSQWRMALRS